MILSLDIKLPSHVTFWFYEVSTMVLVVIACFIALPTAAYVMNEWLARFQYRTQMSWYVMLTVALGSLYLW